MTPHEMTKLTGRRPGTLPSGRLLRIIAAISSIISVSEIESPPRSLSSFSRAVFHISSWAAFIRPCTLKRILWRRRRSGSVGRSPFSRKRVWAAVSRAVRPLAHSTHAASVSAVTIRAR